MNSPNTSARLHKFILASASPARADLLRQIGLEFIVFPSKIEEDLIESGDPIDKVVTLSQAKSRQVARTFKDGIIISADTIVVMEKKILGKPKDEHEAYEILNFLSGNHHHVITGITVLDTNTGNYCSSYETTKVYMKRLSPKIIKAYIKSGEPTGKAGAYAIQGKGGIFIERIEGCYFNVVGLPLAKLGNMLDNIGINIYELFRG